MNSETNSALPSPHDKEKEPPKLTEEQKRQLIAEFFINKSKFPVLSNSIIDEAISQDFLPYEEREKILRNPNKISLFFLQMSPDSPRTRQALQSLELTDEACQIQTFQQFHQQPEDNPIKVLINYLHYLQDKYRELLKIVSTRNQIKKSKVLESKSLHKLQQNKTSISSNQHIFLTDSNNKQSTLSRSFNTRSVEFPHTSYEELLESNIKRQEDYLRTLTTHKHLVEQHMKELQDYYQQRLPVREKKVKAVQEANHQKNQERKLKFIERHERTLKKIKELEEKDQEMRLKIQEQLHQKFESTEANKSQLLSKHQKEMQELQEKLIRKERQRQEKRQLAAQMEEEQIEEIIEKNNLKEQQAEQLLNKLKGDLNHKKLINQQKLEEAMKRVHLRQEHTQYRNLQSYMELADVGSKMVEEQMLLKEKQLEMLKSKSEATLKRVVKNKQKLYQEHEQKIESIIKREDEKDITNKLFTIQSNMESKIKLQSERNRQRLQRALRNTKAFAEVVEQQQQKLIQKISEENQKSKTMKKQQEHYKDAILRQHLRLRQSVDRLVG